MREKSEMNLREAAQQALEALERADNISGYGNNRKAITALRAALAEEQNYVNRWISVEENLPKEGQLVLGLYYKSNITIVYRKAREIIDDRWVIEDGWVEPSSGHSLIPPTHWMPLPEYEHVHKMESNPTINEMETVEPLYTAPPKREPLTKEQLLYVYNQLPNWGMDMDSISQDLVSFARAIERAHGIGGAE